MIVSLIRLPKERIRTKEIRTLEKMDKTKSPKENRPIDEYYDFGHHNGNRGEYFRELKKRKKITPCLTSSLQQNIHSLDAIMIKNSI